MKKSVIALAVALAAGASYAQSSVELYGVADIWFGSTKSTTNGVGERQTVLQDGGLSDSRWGLRGSEDLGGGLRANFVLEQRFSLDDGSAGNGFDRTSWIGLSGNFGEVQLGQPWSAFDDVSAMAASVFDSALAPINTVFLTTAGAASFDNTIKYISPEVAGFVGSFSYSFGEDKTATTSATRIYSFSGMYANGPFTIGIGYINGESDLLADLVGASSADARATRIAGTYDLGAAQLLASIGRGKAELGGDEGKVSEWEIGVNVPLSSALTFSVGYARSKERFNGVDTFKTTGFGAAVSYALSKRTTAYAGFNNTKGEDIPAAGGSVDRDRILAVGIRHTF